MNNLYIGPMTPASQLAPYAQTIVLPSVGSIFYYDSANIAARETIILVHGLQDEADTWRHLFQPLMQRYRVLALDLPGFGRSDKAHRNYTPLFFADTLLQFMDALKIGHATLVGNSLGGMIAEWVALMHPARVSRLILLDGTLKIVERPPASADNILQQIFPAYFNRKYFEALRKDPQAAYDTLNLYYANLGGLPQADQGFLFQRVNERVWDEAQRLAALSVQRNLPRFILIQLPRWLRAIAHSPVPTQVIWGADDAILSARNGQARAVAQKRPVQLLIIPHTGHLPQQESPTAVSDAILT